MEIRTIKKILDLFPDEHNDQVITYGFSEPHAWRGVYAEAAVAPAMRVTIREMKEAINKLLTEEFQGYKGGDYNYGRFTEIHLSFWGESQEHDWSSIIMGLIEAL